MRPTRPSIVAASEQKGMTQAVEQPVCPAENPALKVEDGRRYQDTLLDYDADVNIEISSDKMTAAIAASFPAKGNGRVLTPKGLIEKLQKAGVGVDPDADRAAKVIDQLALGEEVAGTVIARGISATPARDAHIEPFGDWHYPVFPGNFVGRYVPAQPARDGVLVTGEKLPAPGQGDAVRDIDFNKTSGCRLEKETGLVIAEVYGLVEAENGHPVIRALLTISADKMTVTATVYHQTSAKEAVTSKHFQKLFEKKEITAVLRKIKLQQALHVARETNAPVARVILCEGVCPRKGQDGRFEPAVKSSADSQGLEDENRRIDYRARGIVRSVQAGDLLGTLIPPEPGSPGMDVFGWPLPGEQGRPFKLVPGENVKALEDGNEFFATSEGMVFFLGNTLKVTETFETKGDVDFAVGNIKLERGSVSVNGSVLAGFRVEAPGNVVVKEVVENAVIIAGGDVQVGCGIVMDQGGHMDAGGGISALYAQNATLRAQGDVDVAHEINGCSVYAGRRVIATRGRGKIIGGLVRCGEGVLAKEIGSPLGVETTIYLGVNQKTAINLARKTELEETLQKIYTSLGAGEIRAILENTAPEKRQVVAEVLKARVRCEQELQDIENLIDQEREAFQGNFNLRIKALRMIHPDVIIHCFKSRFKVVESLPGATIYYDAQERKLVVA